MLTVIALGMSALASQAYAKAPTTQYWQSPGQYQYGATAVRQAHHGRFRRRTPKSAPEPVTTVAQLRADVAALKREIASIRQEVDRPPVQLSPLLGMIKVPFQLAGLEEPSSFPDLRLPTQPPAAPVPAPLPSLEGLEREAVDRVKAATLYLIKTATMGFTMARQGPETAIGRLHPDFRVKLAEAVKKAREAGLDHVGIFSAYRPPAFGVGGFSDKFNSLHSYGLAVDVAGIGGAGSKSAHLWEHIVKTVGLFLPYGPNNGAEWNHTQLISNKMASDRLRGTITSTQPKDLEKMWLASGDKQFIPSAAAISATAAASAAKLPEVDWRQ